MEATTIPKDLKQLSRVDLVGLAEKKGMTAADAARLNKTELIDFLHSDNGDQADTQHVHYLSPGRSAILSSSSFRGNGADFDSEQDDALPAKGTGYAKFLHAARRHWLLSLVLGVVCAVPAGIITWKVLPVQYQALALLRIASVQPRLVFATVDNGQQNFEGYKLTQMELIKSSFVLNAALRSPNVAKLPIVLEQPDPVAWLAEELQVSSPETTEIIEISLQGEHPVSIAAIVGAVTGAYETEVVNVERSVKTRRLEDLEKLHRQSEQTQRERRTKLRNLAESLGTSDTEGLTIKQQITLQVFSEVRQQHTQLQFELTKLAIQQNHLQARLESLIESKVSDDVLRPSVEADQLWQQYRADVTKFEKQLGIIEEGRKLTASQSESEDKRKKLQEARKVESERLEELRRQVHQDLVLQSKNQLEQLHDQIAVLAEHEKKSAEKVASYEKKAKSIERSSLDLQSMRDDIQQYEKVVDRVGDEMRALRVELQSPPRIQLIQPAEIPHSKDSHETQRLISYTAFASFVAFFLPGCCLVWFDLRHQRINSADEIRHELHLPLLGQLPLLSRRHIRRMRALSNGNGRVDGALSEAVTLVRTMLLDSVTLGSPRTLLVTSALGGEGKTTLSTQLAMNCARGGLRTLLIDSDFRRPSAHEAFHLGMSPGLSEVLNGDSELIESIRPTQFDNLFVLTAGQYDHDVISLLAGDHVGQLFEQLQGEFDFIVVDSAPVLSVPDVHLIARHVDAVIFSIMRDVSEWPRIMAAHELLSMFGVPVLGAVITGSQDAAYGYYGYGDYAK